MAQMGEDYWMNACMHLLYCVRADCKICQRISERIDEEKFAEQGEVERG